LSAGLSAELSAGLKISGAISERSDCSNSAPLHKIFCISVHRSAPLKSHKKLQKFRKNQKEKKIAQKPLRSIDFLGVRSITPRF